MVIGLQSAMTSVEMYAFDRSPSELAALAAGLLQTMLSPNDITTAALTMRVGVWNSANNAPIPPDHTPASIAKTTCAVEAPSPLTMPHLARVRGFAERRSVISDQTARRRRIQSASLRLLPPARARHSRQNGFAASILASRRLLPISRSR